MLKAPYYLDPTELDEQIFAATVPKDHYLRLVLATVDFQRFRDLLAACYSDAMGRPAIEPVVLLKLEFLQFHYQLSDREVVEQAQYNMAFRFFLGLSLGSSLPHHTLLTKFRQRLGSDTHQQIFDDLVGQARERGLVKDRLRLKDATHVLANIAVPSTIRLVAQTRQRLLEAARPYQPESVAQEEAEALRIRQTTVDLRGEERLLQRVVHLRTIVAWADQLLARVQEQAAADEARSLALAKALQLAHKILDDRADPQAGDKVISVQDSDARSGKHGQWYAGYMLDVAVDADSELITGLNVLAANGDEAADASVLIGHEESVHGNDVETLSIDGVGFQGARLREWTDPAGLALEVIVPPKPTPPTGLFTPEQFTLDASGEALTCPAGQTTRRHHRNGHDSGNRFVFAQSTCAACPLLGQCLQKLPQKTGRTVQKNDHEAEYQAARAKVQTPEYQRVRRQHPRVERKLGELVRWHGARQARYRGRLKVLVQGLLTGLVVNIKRVVRLLGQGRVPSPGTLRAEQVAGG